MSEAITSILKQQGWQEIEEIFNEEIFNHKKLVDIKADDKTNEQLGEIYRARQEAVVLLKRALNRIKREGNVQEFKKESYK